MNPSMDFSEVCALLGTLMVFGMAFAFGGLFGLALFDFVRRMFKGEV